jgi:Ca-activated chloride channel homolog
MAAPPPEGATRRGVSNGRHTPFRQSVHPAQRRLGERPGQDGAADFLAWLRAPSQQKMVFTDAGFRSYEGKLGAAIAASSAVLANGAAVILTPPSSSVLAGIRAAWAELRKPAQVLLLLDVSGSMGEEVGSAGESKLELANAAALQSLSQFTDRDEMAVWAFTTDLPPKKNVYQELVPLAPLGQSRTQVRNAISDLIPLNGTPLYAATRQAVAKLRDVSDPSKITGVVLLTDGQNEYPADDDLDGLVEDLNDDSVESGVRVFSVAYGDSADLETLTKISEASKAAAYDATDPANIERVFTAVVSNF